MKDDILKNQKISFYTNLIDIFNHSIFNDCHFKRIYVINTQWSLGNIAIRWLNGALGDPKEPLSGRLYDEDEIKRPNRFYCDELIFEMPTNLNDLIDNTFFKKCENLKKITFISYMPRSIFGLCDTGIFLGNDGKEVLNVGEILLKNLEKYRDTLEEMTMVCKFKDGKKKFYMSVPMNKFKRLKSIKMIGSNCFLFVKDYIDYFEIRGMELNSSLTKELVSSFKRINTLKLDCTRWQLTYEDKMNFYGLFKRLRSLIIKVYGITQVEILIMICSEINTLTSLKITCVSKDDKDQKKIKEIKERAPPKVIIYIKKAFFLNKKK